jgi:hypothetical protein
VADPRDQIDDWLAEDVTPLYPPSGSLDRIRQRARQRKTRQATLTAACCAVLIGAGITIPQVISSGTGRPGASHSAPVAANQTTPSVTAPSRGTGGTPSGQGSKIQVAQHTRLSPGTSGTLVPPNFRPTSVTFAGNGSGGVVGAVLGQAATPGHCATKDCTSLAGTSTYGNSWYGVSAPVAPGPRGSTGVSQLRFANLSDGWAYGPALYETSEGGWPWVPEDTDGQRVIDIEASSTSAFAIFGTCTGASSRYAADCSSYSLWTSAAGSQTWTPVSVPAAYQQMKSTSSAAPLLVISGNTTGYLITPAGEVLSGPVSGGSWQAVGQAPCKPGPAAPAARTAASPGAQLSSGPELLLACDGLAASTTPQPSTSASAGGSTTAGGSSAAPTILYRSVDGKSWQSDGPVPATGTPTSLASSLAGQAVLTTTTGIWYLAGEGKTWQQAAITGGVPTNGFTYVGMTTPYEGTAIPANAQLGEVYITTNQGLTWTASKIS